jgi:type II secretory pathway pseudopilin PulG
MKRGYLGHKPCSAQRQPGIVLLALLIVFALGGLSAMIAIDVWQVSRQREREQDMLFIGAQMTKALEHYYYSAPAGQPRLLPSSLSDLLQDPRYQVPVRHLRRIYTDPMTGDNAWVFERVGRGMGVHSLSQAEPLKQAGFSSALSTFNGKKRYSEWVFVFTPPLIAVTVQTAPVLIPPRATASKPAPLSKGNSSWQ